MCLNLDPKLCEKQLTMTEHCVEVEGDGDEDYHQDDGDDDYEEGGHWGVVIKG